MNCPLRIAYICVSLLVQKWPRYKGLSPTPLAIERKPIGTAAVQRPPATKTEIFNTTEMRLIRIPDVLGSETGQESAVLTGFLHIMLANTETVTSVGKYRDRKLSWLHLQYPTCCVIHGSSCPGSRDAA
jgi:hypothetical protein